MLYIINWDRFFTSLFGLIGCAVSVFLSKNIIFLEYPENCATELDVNILDLFFSYTEEKMSKLVDVIIDDYKEWNRSVQQRQTISLVVGTLLLTASFSVLSNTVQKNQGLISFNAFLSIGLYMFWALVLHWTEREFNTESYKRMRIIEATLGMIFGYKFGVHYSMNEIRVNKKKFKIRTLFWQLLLFLLSLIWFLIGVFPLLLR